MAVQSHNVEIMFARPMHMAEWHRSHHVQTVW